MNCPINERTADGDLVGRCWFYLPDGVTCPRHGNVSEAVEVFNRTKRLTAEVLRCEKPKRPRTEEDDSP